MRLTQHDIMEIHQIADALQDRARHLSERTNLLDKNSFLGVQELSVLVGALRHYAGSPKRDGCGIFTYDKQRGEYTIVENEKRT